MGACPIARAICNFGLTQEAATASLVASTISTPIPFGHTRQIATLA